MYVISYLQTGGSRELSLFWFKQILFKKNMTYTEYIHRKHAKD